MATVQPKFYNQDMAMNEVNNSLGELIVIDSLTGYGKTFFLDELRRKYKDDGWQTVYVSLATVQSKVEVVASTLKGLSEEHSVPVSSLNEEALWFELIKRLSSGKQHALFYDDVHEISSQTFMWVQNTFSHLIKEELLRRNHANFLLIFAGVCIPNPRAWPPHRKLSLVPFDRNTILEFIDSTENEDIRELLKETQYVNWLVNKLLKLSGGHPRAFTNLFQEINNGNWKPYKGFAENRDKENFEKFVKTEIDELIFSLGLNDNYKALISNLSVFRKVDTSIVNAIKKKYQPNFDKESYQIIRELRGFKLLDKNLLDPLLRNGSVSQMILCEPEKYQELNFAAQKTYERLVQSIKEMNSIELVEDGIRESFYHCLCYTNKKIDISRSLRVWVQLLDEAFELNNIHDVTSRDVIDEIATEDVDIRSMLDDYGISLKELYDFIDINVHPNNDLNDHYKLLCQKCAVAVYNDTKTHIVGTGFWINSSQCLVTCAHVIKSLNKQIGESSVISPNDRDISYLDAKIIWYQPPEDTDPANWKARDDIAILELQSPYLRKDFLSLGDRTDDSLYSDTTLRLFSFGYPAPNKNKGEAYDSLKLKGLRANGFIQIENQGESKIDLGVSGSPLCNLDTGYLIGMIQARKLPNQMYFIPSDLISELVVRLGNHMEKQND